MAAKREKIHFESMEELLGAPEEKEGAVYIRTDQILPFEHHPFKVLDDDKMDELVESIKLNGVLTPVIVRPDDQGTYEMISGHRRLHAAKRAGLETIPALIHPMTDDEATIAMVDANVQREEILPSERAFALKMKMDAMRRQGARTDLLELKSSTYGTEDRKLRSAGENDTTSGTKCRRLESAEEAGENFGLKARQVRKYVRLTELVPELLQYVDEKRINLATAVEISYLSKEMQTWIAEYIHDNGAVQEAQIVSLKNETNLDNITQYTMIQILNAALPQRKDRGKITFSPRRLDKYFPVNYTSAQRQDIIIGLLEKWKKEQEDSGNV